MSPAAANLAKYKTPARFLPRVQLCGSGKHVKKGLIGPGHYGVPGQEEDEILDLGTSIDVLVLAMREKALDWGASDVVVSYDPDSDVFQDIAERATHKDSKCMAGPSFLVFERSTGKLYEFFCNNKSSQQESTKFGEFMAVSEEAAAEWGVEPRGPQPMTLKTRFIDPDDSDFSWWVPVVCKCSTPFSNLPEVTELVTAINKFVNPPTEDREVADDDGRDR